MIHVFSILPYIRWIKNIYMMDYKDCRRIFMDVWKWYTMCIVGPSWNDSNLMQSIAREECKHGQQRREFQTKNTEFHITVHCTWWGYGALFPAVCCTHCSFECLANSVLIWLYQSEIMAKTKLWTKYFKLQFIPDQKFFTLQSVLRPEYGHLGSKALKACCDHIDHVQMGNKIH